MDFRIILKNTKAGCHCNIFETDSTKVAKRCVEAMNGAPCMSIGCDKADTHCKAESIKIKKK